LPLTKPRQRPRQTTPEPRPWAEIRSALHADDDVSQALAAFASGEIDFRQLNRALEAAETEPSTRNPRHRCQGSREASSVFAR
jgi:hypothetical protein